AEQLRQRLEARGEKAWVAPVAIDGRTMYRVNVGPKFERARLEALQSGIDAEFGVNSLVKRYLP
ncbi:MAG: SPOR domain-containing protein, partial [Haliea sp.]